MLTKISMPDTQTHRKHKHTFCSALIPNFIDLNKSHTHKWSGTMQGKIKSKFSFLFEIALNLNIRIIFTVHL